MYVSLVCCEHMYRSGLPFLNIRPHVGYVTSLVINISKCALVFYIVHFCPTLGANVEVGSLLPISQNVGTDWESTDEQANEVTIRMAGVEDQTPSFHTLPSNPPSLAMLGKQATDLYYL